MYPLGVNRGHAGHCLATFNCLSGVLSTATATTVVSARRLCCRGALQPGIWADSLSLVRTDSHCPLASSMTDGQARWALQSQQAWAFLCMSTSKTWYCARSSSLVAT